MTVSSRHILTGSLAAFALIGASSVAIAGGGDNSKRHRVPSVQSGHGSKAPRPHYQPRVIVPGVKVHAPNVVVNQGNVSINQSFVNLGGGAVATSSFIGGGGFATPATPVATSSLSGLAVVGGEQTITETYTEQVPVTEERCVAQVTQVVAVRPVQAVCIDDKGTPHPASRLTADEAVNEAYKGEIFRCLAGTHMQVTLGQIEGGSASFAHGETFSCRKGEALRHGAGGELTCAPAMPQRNCNERSLLRRHGPGIKFVSVQTHQETCVPTQHTTYQTVIREVQRTVAHESSSIVLDGGVGQGVF